MDNKERFIFSDSFRKYKEKQLKAINDSFLSDYEKLLVIEINFCDFMSDVLKDSLYSYIELEVNNKKCQ